MRKLYKRPHPEWTIPACERVVPQKLLFIYDLEVRVGQSCRKTANHSHPLSFNGEVQFSSSTFSDFDSVCHLLISAIMLFLPVLLPQQERIWHRSFSVFPLRQLLRIKNWKRFRNLRQRVGCLYRQSSGQGVSAGDRSERGGMFWESPD